MTTTEIQRYWWPEDAAAADYGYPVIESPYLLDGELRVIETYPRTILLGTRPWTELDWARETGRRLARTRLAGVLEWLGEDPGPTPADPMPQATAQQLLQALAAAGDLRPALVHDG